MFGWTNRVMRTGHLALRGFDEGYETEASPLIRSMLEHALSLAWLAHDPANAFQSLVRQRQQQVDTLRRAQSTGWALHDEIQCLIDETLALPTDEASKHADALLAIKRRALDFGHGHLYQAWLVETWSSHACLSSANPYYESGKNEQIVLLPQPRRQPLDIPAQCVIAALIAVDSYCQVLPTDATDRIRGLLGAWEKRLALAIKLDDA